MAGDDDKMCIIIIIIIIIIKYIYIARSGRSCKCAVKSQRHAKDNKTAFKITR